MDASVFTAVVVGLFVILLLKWMFIKDRRPPGPWGLPLLGYIPFLSRLPHLDLQRLAQKYGDVFSIRLGSRYIIVLNDFQSSKEAFSQDVFIGRPPYFAFEVSKENIETGAFFGLPWKEHRRFCLHTLRDLGLGKSKMEEHIKEEISELFQHVEQNVDKPFTIRDIIAPSMSNNIATLVFGERYKYDHPIRKMMSKAVADASREAGQVAWTLFFPWLKNICKFLGIGNIDRVSKINEEMKAFVDAKIEEHEKTLKPGHIRDFIDGYLLEIEKRKDDPTFIKPVLHDMVQAFFGAGSETVRVCIEWLVLISASHQDAQRRIQAEIDDVIGSDRLPVWLDHKTMPYTEAFIMEMMRWRTIVPLNLLRYTLADTELNGFFIPKHTAILSNMWAIHHDPKFWGPDADEFRPERFLTDGGKEVKRMEQYIPFSIGKRACPGEPLAKIEIFLYFVAILQKFNIRMPAGKLADFEGELGISLVPKLQEIILTKRI